MSDTVDTMIDNAIARANSRGRQADFYAWKAFSGVDEFTDPAGTPITSPTDQFVLYTTDPAQIRKFRKKYPGLLVSTKVAQPPKYADLPTLPASPSAFEVAAFRAALEAMLDEFFAAYFSIADAYVAAETWVIDALTTDDPKLPGTNLDLIWRRAQQNTQALGSGLIGLDLPAVTPTTHTTPAYSAFAHAESYARSAAKVELWKFAVSSHIKDLRINVITAAGDYIKALMAADTTVVKSQTAIMQAQTALKKAAADWYIVQLSPILRDSERLVTSLSEDRSVDMTKAGALTERALMAADAAIKGAEAVAMVAQAAQASLNSVVGSSQVGF